MAGKIKVALVGLGNCASSLVQGLHYYRDVDGTCEVDGLMHPSLGGYLLNDIVIVLGVDVNANKIDEDLARAIFVPPNNAARFVDEMPLTGATVRPGMLLDGIAPRLRNNFPIRESSRKEIIQWLDETGAEMIVLGIPTGSPKAARFWAQICLDTGRAFINTIPEFIASDPVWAQRFEDAGIPCGGDDVMSQVGATFTNRALVEMIVQRGCKIQISDQINRGGNADFQNLELPDRVKSKLISKTEGIRFAARTGKIMATPAGYYPELGDTKEAIIYIEWDGFAGKPYKLRLSYEGDDSPNWAGVVVDMIRLMKLSLDRGLRGPQSWSPWYCKHPLHHVDLATAHRMVEDFIAG